MLGLARAAWLSAAEAMAAQAQAVIIAHRAAMGARPPASERMKAHAPSFGRVFSLNPRFRAAC